MIILVSRLLHLPKVNVKRLNCINRLKEYTHSFFLPFIFFQFDSNMYFSYFRSPLIKSVRKGCKSSRCSLNKVKHVYIFLIPPEMYLKVKWKSSDVHFFLK